MTPCQLIVDPPQPGAWNMAVDEWLLRRAAEEGVFTLRLYQWSEPTLSLGYFQSLADRNGHEPSLTCPVVRRASGGGAIVHDHELTYSLAVPANHPMAGKQQDLYDAAHVSLVEVLNKCVPLTMGKFTRCRQTEGRGRQEPFLCFLRRAKGDVIFISSSTTNDKVSDGSFKLCGSAQRKLRGAVLQHGGVLLAQSQHAPELPGVGQLAGTAIKAATFGEIWLRSLAEHLLLDLQADGGLGDEARRQIALLEAEKFAHNSWTGRR